MLLVSPATCSLRVLISPHIGSSEFELVLKFLLTFSSLTCLASVWKFRMKSFSASAEESYTKLENLLPLRIVLHTKSF